MYMGGSAALVEQSLGLSGEELLYVGDHIFVDVNISKNISRWRTALIVRELEEEIGSVGRFRRKEEELSRLMLQKEELEAQLRSLRLAAQRIQSGYGPRPDTDISSLQETMAELSGRIAALDASIAPIAQAAARLLNPNWGPLMRTGADKSHLARQIERYADIYTARVSNFLHVTPFAFLRSSRGSLPHDPECAV
jgi:5'-nucleotidase